jgi:hypothetical protein
MTLNPGKSVDRGHTDAALSLLSPFNLFPKLGYLENPGHEVEMGDPRDYMTRAKLFSYLMKH